MEQKKIDEIRARCEAATPGEWHALDDWLVYTGDYIEGTGISNEQMVCTTKDGAAKFIAHARQDIPELLDEIDRLTAEVKMWKETAEYSDSVVGCLEAELDEYKNKQINGLDYLSQSMKLNDEWRRLDEKMDKIEKELWTREG